MRFIVLVLLTVVFLNNVVLAQRNLSFLDSELKDKDKKALVKRIKTFTKKIRKARWNEVYELLSENIIGGRTKEEFILEMKEDSINPLLKRKVLGFLPKTFLEAVS